MSINYEGMDLDSLVRLSKQTSKMIDIEMAKFETTFKEVAKNVPDEQRGILEAAKVNMNKAIALAKEGKVDEANTIISNLKNNGR